MNGCDLSEAALASFSGFIAEHLGLDFPPARWSDLQRGLAAACPDLGFAHPAACVQALLSSALDREQVEILASHLTIGETYFFREPQSFDLLGERVLPELIAARRGGVRSLRFWSAGCATGEEPYSLAILLHRLLPDLPDWHVTILATDINPGFLQKAAAGVYSEWSFRGTPAWLREQYFTRVADGRWELLPQVRKLVSFACLNLAKDVYPSLVTNTNAMDLILCRNVLMYFKTDVAAEVIQRFHRALVDGGWLSVSPADAAHLPGTAFAPAHLPGAILHQKAAPPPEPGGARRPGVRELPAAPERTRPSVRSRPGSLPRRKQAARAAPPRPNGSSLRESTAPPPRQQAFELFKTGRYAEAAQLLARQVSQEPGDAEAMGLLVRACANLGRLAEALAWCEKALTADRLAVSLHFLKAAILQEQGRGDEAVAALQRVLYLEPDHLMAHFFIGNLLHQQGKDPEAIPHFTRALALLDPKTQNDVVPESEGITAGRLRQIIEATLRTELAA